MRIRRRRHHRRPVAYRSESTVDRTRSTFDVTPRSQRIRHRRRTTTI